MLQCPNPHCQYPNPEDHKFCQKCRAPLMSRYLWAVGKHAAAFNPGEVLADRYRCKGPRIFLDEKPALPPGNVDEVPESFTPYLRLSPYQLHVPQVYDWVVDAGSPDRAILLLDQVPLYSPQNFAERGIGLAQTQGTVQEVQLFPTLTDMWEGATPLRQLHWLWQIADLWQYMSSERVASSLLQPELLRVEGPILRLLELRFDSSGSISLTELGKFWSTLVPTAKPAIQTPLQQLCQQLMGGSIHSAEGIVNALDQSIANLGQSQQTREIHIATLTDQGPSRQRNEDACYPKSGTTVTVSPPEAPLVIVCDGIGGHQGGDVASNTAIEVLEEEVKALRLESLNPTTLEEGLKQAVAQANNQISQKNDEEQRFDRQRMGTTVVMGLVRAHELYVTHVGDSRAYWITRWGCHQITQDDDVASREVRLGYSTYPQALQQPSAGSLVQALGMGSSTNLYPTVQRFILDEDSVFLFCSDGLSDNDRVEEYWERTLLPLLDGRKDLATVSQELIQIANDYNGYDNATVGIIHCRVEGTKSPAVQVGTASVPAAATVQLAPNPSTLRRRTDTAIYAPGAPLSPPTTPSPLPTSEPTLFPKTQQIEPLPERRSSRASNNIVLLLVSLFLGMGILAILIGRNLGLLPWLMPTPEPETASSPAPSSSATPDPTTSPTESSEEPTIIPISPPERFQTGVNLFVASEENIERARTSLGPIIQIPTNRRIYADSIVYAVGQQEFKGQNWIQLKVCSGAITSQTDTLEPQSEITELPPEPDQTANSETGNSETVITNPGTVQKPEKPDSTPTSQTSTFLAPGETGWINSVRYQELLTDETSSLQRLDPNDPAEGVVIPECAAPRGLSQEEDVAEPQDAAPEATEASPPEPLPLQ